MRMWFRPVKGIAFCIVAAFFGSQAMADQRKNLRVFFFKHTTSSVYIKRMPYLLPL